MPENKKVPISGFSARPGQATPFSHSHELVSTRSHLAKPSPGKFLKVCSASGCPPPRKHLSPLFSFIKGKGACAECTPRKQSPSCETLVFMGPRDAMPRGADARMYPNVPECTRMYPNVPCVLVRMYPWAAWADVLFGAQMYPTH